VGTVQRSLVDRYSFAVITFFFSVWAMPGRGLFLRGRRCVAWQHYMGARCSCLVLQMGQPWRPRGEEPDIVQHAFPVRLFSRIHYDTWRIGRSEASSSLSCVLGSCISISLAPLHDRDCVRTYVRRRCRTTMDPHAKVSAPTDLYQ